jgi:uncharacterized membrane protein YhaH (DUF805 family)
MNPVKLLWSFYGRIGRIAYLGGLLLAITLAGAGMIALVHFGPRPSPGEPPDALIVSIIIGGFILLTWAKFALAAKRLHDLGTSGWISLVLIIPLLGFIAVIFLLCASGDAIDNRYGPARRSATPLPQPSRS